MMKTPPGFKSAETSLLIFSLGEIFNALAVGLESFGLAGSHRLGVELESDRMPEGIALVPQQGEEAAIPAAHVQEISVPRPHEAAVEVDLSALPGSL